MPLPLILGVGAAIAGVAGIGGGINGGMKMKKAKDTMEAAQYRYNSCMRKMEDKNKKTIDRMDKLGKLELEILKNFDEFSDVFEKIKNRPMFKKIDKNGVEIPAFDGKRLKEVYVGAGVLLGGIGGAGAGAAGGIAAGGIAAGGATTATVMALGSASTGTAISTLSGAAATNATLAALGGGSLAAGGGGMALGSMILGEATLGVGLLVGGMIFNFTGNKLSDKADEAMQEVRSIEKKANTICNYLDELKTISMKYYDSLVSVKNIYEKYLLKLKDIVEINLKQDWNDFSEEEKLITENTVLLVGLLYNMCKVELVKKSSNKNDINKINKEDIELSIDNSKKVLIGLGE